jgi:hypothetical protein
MNTHDQKQPKYDLFIIWKSYYTYIYNFVTNLRWNLRTTWNSGILIQLLKNCLFVIVKSQPLKFCLNSCAFSHPCYTICSYVLEEKFWKKYKMIFCFVNQLKNKINLFLSGKLFPLPPSPPYQNLKVKKKVLIQITNNHNQLSKETNTVNSSK